MQLVGIRIALLLAFAGVTAWLASSLAGVPFQLAAAPQLAAVYFIPVNLICLWLLTARTGTGRLRRLLDLMHFERRRLGRDVLLGLLWQVVLFVPFGLTINLVMLLLFGPADMIEAFGYIFIPAEAAQLVLPGWFAWSSALLVALLFPLTNAPAEELTYRRHAQDGLLARGWSRWAAVVVPSVAFGLQHVLLAATLPGMLVYAAAFTVWGAGAGVIYALSGRLMPVVIAHLFTNLFTGLAPLIILLVTG